MTVYEHAEQIVAMLIFNIDEAAEGEGYDDAEILEEVSHLMAAHTPDVPARENLLVFDIAFRSGTCFPLTMEHQQLMLEALNEWLEG